MTFIPHKYVLTVKGYKALWCFLRPYDTIGAFPSFATKRPDSDTFYADLLWYEKAP